MNENKLFKLIASMPVILLTLYFIPFVGVCLTGLRYFVYRNKKQYSTPITLIVIGIICLIPTMTETVLEIAKINNIPYVNRAIEIADELDFDDFSKTLLTVGILTMIAVYAIKKIANKIENNVSKYMRAQAEAEREINEKNNLKIKEKQEAAKNTHFVKCKSCGGNNVIVGDIGKCKFCRQTITKED